MKRAVGRSGESVFFYHRRGASPPSLPPPGFYTPPRCRRSVSATAVRARACMEEERSLASECVFSSEAVCLLSQTCDAALTSAIFG